MKSSLSPRFEDSVLGPLSVVVSILLSLVQTNSHEGYNFMWRTMFWFPLFPSCIDSMLHYLF